MPTNVTAPSTFTQAGTAGLTLSYELADNLDLALMDRLGGSIVQFCGEPIDLTHTGTDTERQGVLSNVGYQRRFTVSGGETTLNAASGYTLDYWARSVAQYDLSFTQSVKHATLGKPGVTVTLAALERFLPANVFATFRYLFMVAGSSFSDQTVGSAALALSADAVFDLAAAATRKLGAEELGQPECFLDPEQFIEARNSFRSEPAWVQNLGAMQKIQKVQGGQNLGDVFGLGFGVQLSDDVQQSGGAYRGFCGSPGSIRRVKARPSVADLPAGVTPVSLDDWGVVIYQLLQAANAATFGWQALMMVGMAQASATSTLQIRVTSDVA